MTAGDLKQKLLAVMDQWDESETDDYLTTEQMQFMLTLIDDLVGLREALEIIAQDDPCADYVAQQALTESRARMKKLGVEL